MGSEKGFVETFPRRLRRPSNSRFSRKICWSGVSHSIPRERRRTPSRILREKKKKISTSWRPSPTVWFSPLVWLFQTSAMWPKYWNRAEASKKRRKRIFRLLLRIPSTRCRHPSSGGFSIPWTWINRSLIGTHISQETRKIVVLRSLDSLAEMQRIGCV